MNIRRFAPIVVVLLSLLLNTQSGYTQGSSAPLESAAARSADPGARTPIPGGSVAVNITNPGSYFLNGNITVDHGSAITIAASGVTLDLAGFTVSSSSKPAGGIGIHLIRPNSDITILNGHVRGGVTFSGGAFSGGPGFEHGIGFTGQGTLQSVRVSGVSVTGVSGKGIA